MLALVMCVSMLAACKSEDEKKDEAENAVEETAGEAVERIATEFMDALADGDGEAAAELCDGDALKMQAKAAAKSMKDELEYEITNVKIAGDEATVEMEITLNGNETDGSLEFEKIDGDWKIIEVI